MTKKYALACRLGLSILAVAPFGDASAAGSRRWAVSSERGATTLADCTDCGDDVGVTISCAGPGKPAIMTVLHAASEQGKDGETSPIKFNVDERTFSYTARTAFYGQVGYTPVIELRPGDPLLYAIRLASVSAFRGGAAMKIYYRNRAATQISLDGATRPINTFLARCGWGPDEAEAEVQQPVPSRPPPLAPTPHLEGYVAVQIRNTLGAEVAFEAIDREGRVQTRPPLAPGDGVESDVLPGTTLVFSAGGREVGRYLTTAARRQAFTLTRAPEAAPAGKMATPVFNPQLAPAAPSDEPSMAAPAPSVRPSTATPATTVTQDTAMPPSVAATRPQTAALPELHDEQGATWTFFREGSVANAVFGIPETDASSIAISCLSRGPMDRARGAALASMEFVAAPTLAPGSKMSVQISSSRNAYELQGRANGQRRLVATLGPASRSLKDAIRGVEWFEISVQGKAAGRFLGLGSSTAGRRFLSACQQIGG